MRSLEGQVVLITGATSGIGRECSRVAAQEGARVIVTGRNAERGAATVQLAREAGGWAEFMRLDVTREHEWQAVIGTIMERHGRLDALVNNAGESILRPLERLELEDLEFLLAVNLEACFLGMKYAMPAIRASGGGMILNVSSVAGIRAGPNSTIYGASKAALTGLSAAAALEGASSTPEVCVNSIHPGLIWGEGPVESLGEEGARVFREKVVAKTPLRRVGEVDDVARVVAYLLSPAARVITGQQIVVDGGLSLAYP